jgi:putative transposase
VLRTYSLNHDKRDEIEPLLRAYKRMLNAMLGDIWASMRWREVKVKGRKQSRLLPLYSKDNSFKRRMRDKHLKDWSYSAHWVDSALKTAFSMMDSWRKNYVRDTGRESVQERGGSSLG